MHMTKLFSKLTIALCAFFYSFVLYAINIPPYLKNIASPLRSPVIQNYCEANLNQVKMDFQNQNPVSVLPGIATQLQNIRNAITITCFHNPYKREMASDVIFVSMPIIQKIPTNLASSELVMNVKNFGNIEHNLISVKSPAAKQIQLQIVSNDRSGAITAKLTKQIPININDSFDISGGKYRIIMINFNSKLRSMDKVPLILGFDDGSIINIYAGVSCENFYQ